MNPELQAKLEEAQVFASFQTKNAKTQENMRQAAIAAYADAIKYYLKDIPNEERTLQDTFGVIKACIQHIHLTHDSAYLGVLKDLVATLDSKAQQSYARDLVICNAVVTGKATLHQALEASSAADKLARLETAALQLVTAGALVFSATKGAQKVLDLLHACRDQLHQHGYQPTPEFITDLAAVSHQSKKMVNFMVTALLPSVHTAAYKRAVDTLVAASRVQSAEHTPVHVVNHGAH